MNVPKKPPAIKGKRGGCIFAGFLPCKLKHQKLQQFLPQSAHGYLQSLERWPEITFQIRSAIWADSKPTSTALGMVRSCPPENADATVPEQVTACAGR